jgi:hypothetical protein
LTDSIDFDEIRRIIGSFLPHISAVLSRLPGDGPLRLNRKDRGPMSTDGKSTPHTWHDLAEQATKESDPEKLMEIIEELCGVLQMREEGAKPKREST